MSKRTRWIVGLALVAAVVILTTTLQNSAIGVEVAQVTVQSLESVVQEEGRTRVTERYTITAPIAGELERLEVREGDAVSEGSVVARIRPVAEDPRAVRVRTAQLESARAQQTQAEALVEAARVQAEQLDRQLLRTEALAVDSIVSAQELEQAQLAARSARRQLESAEAAGKAAAAAVSAARAALSGADSYMTVRAPSAGRVLRIPDRSARVVQPGTPLIEIGNADNLEVVVDVLTSDAVQMMPGAAVRIDDWGGDTPLEGVIRMIEPDGFTQVSALGVEEQRVNVIVDLNQRPPALGSGYRVEASIITWSSDAVLVVSTAALFRLESDWHVFTVSEGIAHQVAVDLGHRSAEYAEVLGGLSSGDTVILFPSDDVQDGVAVTGNTN